MLEEELDENYEPTEQGESGPGQRRMPCAWLSGALHTVLMIRPCGWLLIAEILEYAHWLGMDVEKEKVREALEPPHNAQVDQPTLVKGSN